MEPETKNWKSNYPNGISTSLPKKVQIDFLKTIKGLENAVIEKFGYAVEYDCIESNEIKNTYETKKINDYILLAKLMVLLVMRRLLHKGSWLELMQQVLIT